MAYYKRWLGPNFINQLKGDYSFLINCSYRREGDYKFDIQFRPNNTIMIYFGGTCLLTVTFNEKSNQIQFFSDSYRNKHPTEFKKIRTGSPIEDQKKACLNFLETASSNVSPKWNKEGSEGYWEQRMCRLWGGPAWQEFMDILVIDRQAVISFDNDSQKNKFYQGIKTKYIDVINNLSYKYRWKKKKEFGDELDILAIGPDKELVCIELKTAKTDKDFYYAPLQAAAYCEAFNAAARSNPSFFDDIKKIIEQKVEVGLLPNSALNRLPEYSFELIKAQLIIMDSSKLSLDSQVWSRISDVVERIGKPYRPVIRAIP